MTTTTTNIVLTDSTAGTLLWNGSYLQLTKRKSIPVTVNLTAEFLQLCRTSGQPSSSNNSAPSKTVERFVFDQIASCEVMSTEEVLHQEKESRRRRGRSRCLGRDKKSLLQQRLLETDVCLQMVIYPAAVASVSSSSSSSSSSEKRPHRRIVTLIINSHSSHEENLNEAELFQRKVATLIHSGHSASKPVLIILNPKSGKGKTIKIFDRKVKPLLDDCGIKYHVLVTKHANHASEFIEGSHDLAASYSAVVTVSGDGLLFEVLNGFVSSLERLEVKQIPIPISIIPGGSGNGLAHSINSIFLGDPGGVPRKSANQVLDCTFHVIKGQPVAMDLVRITTRDKVYLSFLSFGWGLMADVDIESERLRCIGEPRFAIWSIYRSLALRTYGGTLSYLPVGEANQGVDVPPLDVPIKEDGSQHWVVERGDFVLVYAAYQRYLNSSVMFAPASTLDDQTIYLLYIKSGVSSCQVIQFLLALEDGSHVGLPFVSFVPVRAFRLEPTSDSNIMTIDGEQIACSPVQAQVSMKANILLRSPQISTTTTTMASGGIASGGDPLTHNNNT